MSSPVRFSEEAEAEAADAADWYEGHRAGLGLQFLTAVAEAVARVEGNPGIGAPTPGIEDEAIRRVAVRRFPYHLVFIELSDRVQVLAVAHDRRRPGYWAGRLTN